MQRTIRYVYFIAAYLAFFITLPFVLITYTLINILLGKANLVFLADAMKQTVLMFLIQIDNQFRDLE